MIKIKSFSAALMSVMALNSILSVTPVSASEIVDEAYVSSQEDSTSSENGIVHVNDSDVQVDVTEDAEDAQISNIDDANEDVSATGVDVSEDKDGSVLADYDTSTGVLRIYPGGEGTKVLSTTFIKHEDEMGGLGYGSDTWIRINDCTSEQFKKVIVEAGVKAPSQSYGLFSCFANAEEIDVSGLDVSNTYHFASMFVRCRKLKKLDLSGFDMFVSNSDDVDQMFIGLDSLEEIKTPRISGSTVEIPVVDSDGFTRKMFDADGNVYKYLPSDSKTLSLKKGEVFNVSGTGVDVSEAGDGSVLADYDTSTGDLRIYPGVNGTKVLAVLFLAGRLEHNSAYRIKDATRHQFKKVTVEPGVKIKNGDYLFANFINVETFEISNLDTSEMDFMYGMFDNCENVKTLDLSSFNTSNVLRMNDMFTGCKNLESVDISSFDTSKVCAFDNMFEGCESLKSIDISNFNSSNFEYRECGMREMFKDCKSLESLDMSNFDTTGCVHMYGMFSGCENLETLKLGTFDTSKTVQFQEMFKDCKKLKSLDISSFDLTDVGTGTIYDDLDDTQEAHYFVSDFLSSMDSLEEIKTPKTIPVSFNEIPVTDSDGNIRTMYDTDGNTYEYLPLESKTLYFSKQENNQDSENNTTNPVSEPNKTDGSDVETISSGNAKFVFDAEKSDTVVVSKTYDIGAKLKNLEKDSAYVSTAKHRYTVDNKKIASINKKGQLKPKKSGEINIYLEQKEKGGSWQKIGTPVHMYIQMPKMKKDETVKEGTTLDAYTLLSRTTYSPTKWESTNKSVATVDEKGIITVLKKGNTKIIAVYGEGKDSSKKKYATKLKVTK